MKAWYTRGLGFHCEGQWRIDQFLKAEWSTSLFTSAIPCQMSSPGDIDTCTRFKRKKRCNFYASAVFGTVDYEISHDPLAFS